MICTQQMWTDMGRTAVVQREWKLVFVYPIHPWNAEIIRNSFRYFSIRCDTQPTHAHRTQWHSAATVLRFNSSFWIKIYELNCRGGDELFALCFVVAKTMAAAATEIGVAYALANFVCVCVCLQCAQLKLKRKLVNGKRVRYTRNYPIFRPTKNNNKQHS